MKPESSGAKSNVTINVSAPRTPQIPGYPKNLTSNISGGINNSWLIPLTQGRGNYTVNISDYVYPNLYNFTNFVIVVQNATTDLTAYSSGDDVSISGVYWDRSSNVTIDIKNSSGLSASGYPKDVEVNSEGIFNTDWIAQPGSGFGAEQYNITVSQKLDSSENDTMTVYVTKAATLSTNKNYYQQN